MRKLSLALQPWKGVGSTWSPQNINLGTDRFDGNFDSLRQPFALDVEEAQKLNARAMADLAPSILEEVNKMRANYNSLIRENFSDRSGPGFGMMAFGVGENERGKKVARGASLVYNPATGKMETNFAEHQLDPDDPMLPKGAVENYDTKDAIEVEFEEERGKIQAPAEGATEVEFSDEKSSSNGK